MSTAYKAQSHCSELQVERRSPSSGVLKVSSAKHPDYQLEGDSQLGKEAEGGE